MLILEEKQVQKSQLKLSKKNQKIPGFVYLNRLFMPLEPQLFHRLETAIVEYKKWLLERDICPIILKQSHSYSIWCLAPGTAKRIQSN